MSDPRYPIGRFQTPRNISWEDRDGYLDRIRSTPERLRALVGPMTPAQLATPYREGGWTVRQVVHHLADSHMQAYGRTKLALTEDNPMVKPYREGAWADLIDTGLIAPERSLTLLECLHERWMALLDSFANDEWARSFEHPELGRMGLDLQAALYAWHGDHHIGHVRLVAERQE